MTDVREQLEAAGRRLRAAEDARAAAMAEIVDLARRAQAADVPIRQIALLSGVTRPTVYRMLEGDK